MLYFMNMLTLLSKATAQTPVKELQIGSIYQQVVNNPYLRLFYQILIEPDLKRVFEDQAKSA